VSPFLFVSLCSENRGVVYRVLFYQNILAATAAAAELTVKMENRLTGY